MPTATDTILMQSTAAIMFRDDAGFIHVREISDFASVPFERDEKLARKYYARCIKRA